MTTAHAIYEATTHQIAGLELERQAHLQQIAGLVAERDALREINTGLRTTLAAARATLDMWRRAYYAATQQADNAAELVDLAKADVLLEDYKRSLQAAAEV